MSYDQTYPFPQVFLVSEGGGSQHSVQQPNLVPCWSFPPPQERMRNQGRSRGCRGMSTGAALVVLMLFLLVFTALGFEAYQIHNIQKELRGRQEAKLASEPSTPEKQIGLYEPVMEKDQKDDRPAAHVMGRIEKGKFSETLRWDPHVGRAYTSGGVSYHLEDGALQVNESGLYHVYSRVEFIFKECTSLVHSMFVRREGRPLPLILMKAHREGSCPKKAGHPWSTESYLGSAVQLQQHDRVYVNVSHPAFLSHVHYANFFGLYKI